MKISVLMTSPFSSNSSNQANLNLKNIHSSHYFKVKVQQNVSKNPYKKHQNYTYYTILHSDIYNILQQPKYKNKTGVPHSICTYMNTIQQASQCDMSKHCIALYEQFIFKLTHYTCPHPKMHMKPNPQRPD